MIYYKTYTRETNEEWMVLIHGVGGSSVVWYKQIKELRKHFNLIVVDLRGHGKSTDKLSDVRNPTFITSSDDIIEVLKELEVDKFHITGLSLGSIIATAINSQVPERVISLNLIGAVEKFEFVPQT